MHRCRCVVACGMTLSGACCIHGDGKSTVKEVLASVVELLTFEAENVPALHPPVRPRPTYGGTNR